MTFHERHTAMHTLPPPSVSDPPPPVPYFRPARVPEPHWRVVEAVAGRCPPPSPGRRAARTAARSQGHRAALNGRVNDLWPTVPWWVRDPALPHVAEDISRWWRR